MVEKTIGSDRRCTPHGLRHTGASLEMARGTPLERTNPEPSMARELSSKRVGHRPLRLATASPSRRGAAVELKYSKASQRRDQRKDACIVTGGVRLPVACSDAGVAVGPDAIPSRRHGSRISNTSYEFPSCATPWSGQWQARPRGDDFKAPGGTAGRMALVGAARIAGEGRRRFHWPEQDPLR
jgi:hypothetical protein